MIRNGGAEALGILRGPIDKVTLTPADDHFAVEMKGAMEGMLALAQTDTGRVVLSFQVFRSSIKVVAVSSAWLRTTS